MITSILIMWILIKLQAPLWCLILSGLSIIASALEIFLNILTKRLEKLEKELERKRILEKLSGR